MYLNVSGRFVHQRVDCADACRPLGAGHIVCRDVHGAADLQLTSGLLRNAEVHVDRIERLERDQRIAAGQVLSQVDVTNAQNPGEGRADRLALNHRPDFPDLRIGLPILGGRAIELGSRDHSFIEQSLHPLEREPRELMLRFGRRQLRLFLARIQQGEHFAGAHRLSGLEQNLFDRAGKIGAHRNTLHGREGPDRVQRGRPLLLLRHDGSDGFGGGRNAAPCAIAV